MDPISRDTTILRVSFLHAFTFTFAVLFWKTHNTRSKPHNSHCKYSYSSIFKYNSVDNVYKFCFDFLKWKMKIQIKITYRL